MPNTTNSPSIKLGTDRVVEVNDIQIPDLWHVAQALKKYEGYDLFAEGRGVIDGPKAGERVLECWHLVHDLLRYIKEQHGIATPR